MARQALDAQSEQAIINLFLQYARRQFHISQVGSIPSGSAGGTSASQVSFVPSSLEQDAVYADSIDLFTTLPITLTVPAGGSCVVSPYAPYSALQTKFLVGGASRFDYLPGTPHIIDELTSYSWYDPAMSYPNSYGAISGGWDNGSSQAAPGYYPNNDGSGAFQPGATISNTGTTAVNVSGTLKFRVKVRLRRRRPNLWGCVPLGDPQNVPQLFGQLSALVGTDPTESLFTAATSGVTASLSAAGSVLAVFPNLGIDVLPAGVPVPEPLMQMAYSLNLNAATPITTAGTIIPVSYKTDMLYDKIVLCLQNNQQAQAADYFALWLTAKQGSARWAYDAANNSYQNLFTNYHEVYKRYFPVGCLINDMYSGRDPEFPGTTPTKAALSPNTDYAAIEGVPPAPLMTMAFRVPAGTVLTSPKLASFEYGVQVAAY